MEQSCTRLASSLLDTFAFTGCNFKCFKMEDILTSMRKQSENLEVKLENSWESDAEFDNAEGSKLNGNILHFDENTPNEIEQDAQETSEKNVFLIDLEIGSKSLQNVPVRSDCLLQDVAEELAKNEMVKVVYFLQEKIKKGGDNYDVSEAQGMFISWMFCVTLHIKNIF